MRRNLSICLLFLTLSVRAAEPYQYEAPKAELPSVREGDTRSESTAGEVSWLRLQDQLALKSGLMSCQKRPSSNLIDLARKRLTRCKPGKVQRTMETDSNSSRATSARSCEALITRIASHCVLAASDFEQTLALSRPALRKAAQKDATPDSSLMDISDKELDRLDATEE